MPAVIQGNVEKGYQELKELERMNFEYSYPYGLDFKPGSKLHKQVVDKVMKLARASASSMTKRFSAWNDIDETMTAYIDLSDDDLKVKEKDGKKPVSIIFPYSYAILETMLGYMLSAFIQDPIFRFEGHGPEDTIGAVLLEKVVEMQCHKAKMILNLHTMFRDAFCYGFGAVGTRWYKEMGYSIVKKEKKRLFGPSVYSKAMQQTVKYEGNILYNIDPYLTLPDPNKPIGNAQKGELFGWLERENLMELLEDEKAGNDLFNMKYVRVVKNRRSSIYPEDSSQRNQKAGGTATTWNDDLNPVDVLTMNVKLIPKEWHLSGNEYPELWEFKIACDGVIIGAKRMKLAHNQIPIGIAAPDFDGYSTTPISRMEVLYGMQHTLDWMFNAHVANVRKAINDTLIVDPYWINVDDLKTPKPGGIVRTRQAVWGRGVKDSVMQLGITDVTRGHMADSAIIREAMDKISGTDGAMMGSLRTSGPERLTGAEFQGTQQGGFTRMKRIAQIVGAQVFMDLGTFFASNTQQFMSQDTYIDTVGQWQEQLIKTYGQVDKIAVTPFDLLIDYDVKVRDGSVPGGNFSESWMKLFELISTNPNLMQRFDIVRIFMHIAENNGAKNIYDFIAKQAPDEMVQQQAQAGNMVPINEAMNAGVI